MKPKNKRNFKRTVKAINFLFLAMIGVLMGPLILIVSILRAFLYGTPISSFVGILVGLIILMLSILEIRRWDI